MPGLRDVLDRFRPAGAPGAASAVGVPVDRRRDAEAELESVFAALSPIMEECERLRESAHKQARQRAHEAGKRAEAITGRARDDAPLARSQAASRARLAGEADLAAITAEAGQASTVLESRASQMLPDLVVRVVERVRADIESMRAADEAVPGRAGPAGEREPETRQGDRR